jgi:hypothetical protein
MLASCSASSICVYPNVIGTYDHVNLHAQCMLLVAALDLRCVRDARDTVQLALHAAPRMLAMELGRFLVSHSQGCRVITC